MFGLSNTVRHIGIVVERLDHYADLFCECFDFKVISDQIETGKFIDRLLSLNDTKIRVVKLRDKKEQVIELIEFLSEERCENTVKVYSLGITHIAINVSDIKLKIQKLVEFDATCVNDPQANQTSEYLVAYINIGSQVFIELVQKT